MQIYLQVDPLRESVLLPITASGELLTQFELRVINPRGVTIIEVLELRETVNAEWLFPDWAAALSFIKRRIKS